MGTAMNPELIRQFVDGELNAEEMTSIEVALAQDPDLRASVEFERKLRNSVMHALSGPEHAAPESMHAEIQDIFKQETSARLKLATSHSINTDTQDEDTIEFLKGPTRANFLAVAACLVIVAGAILFGIFGPNLLNQPGNSLNGDIQEASNFVEGQHVSCVVDKAALKNKTAFSPSKVGIEMQNHLGKTVVIPDLSNLGYKLIGGGHCGVPPSEYPSGHVIYTSSSGMVGIFMQPNKGQFSQLKLGNYPMVLSPNQCGGLIAWADEDLVYFVTLCNGNDSTNVVKEIRRQTSQTP